MKLCHTLRFGEDRCDVGIANRSPFWGKESVLVSGASKAFTLIEIMIALTIFSFVLIAIYSAWSSILHGSKLGLKVAGEAQRSRMALRALEESLASAQLFIANLPYYSFRADTSGDFADLDFVAHLPASFPGSGLFRDQVVRRVRFSVEAGPGGHNQLVLRQNPLLEPPDATAPPYAIVLAPQVNKFAVEFWNTNKLEWESEWLWTNQLPKMMRVYVNFGERTRGPMRPEDTWIQTISLSSLAIPRELQFPVGGGAGRPLPTPGPNTAVPNRTGANGVAPPGNNPGGPSYQAPPGRPDLRGGRSFNPYQGNQPPMPTKRRTR